MAYNRENKLYFILAVQQTYQLHKTEGVSTRYVYDKFIKPVYHISIATLYVYLSIRAEHEIKLLKEKKEDASRQAKYKQTSMEFFGQ